jgi:hypothetical protein
MVNVDGTNRHTMWLKEFRSTGAPIASGNTIVFEGTIDIWGFHPDMMTEPAMIENGDDVPVKVSIIENNVIAIEIDPSVNDHFGETPIYGTVTRSNLA